MKNLQNVVDHYESDRKKHRRYVAVLSAMSLLISFAVPYSLINPASSITMDDGLATQMLSYANIANNQVTNVSGTDGNGGINKATTSEKALLIGVPTEGSSETREWLASLGDNPSASQIITAAQNKYFLGIASDFCIFLENSLTVKNADAEGRVAVGGNVEFTNSYNYQIGSGDYATNTALGCTDNYVGITDFAHLICTGTITNISTYNKETKVKDAMQAYKNLVIGNESGSTHYNSEGGSWSPGKRYKNGCNCDDVSKDELSQIYEASLINFADAFTFIRSQSEKLSKISATGSVRPMTDADVVTTASSWANEDQKYIKEGLVLTGPGKDSDAKNVYFTIDNWEDMHGKALIFNDIPEYTDENGKHIANIIVNIAGKDITVVDDTNNKINIAFTFINGEEISNTGGNDSNNHKFSENILYNFHEAENLFIDGNFNGTILAPNANVKSDDACQGHLSGSLVAKSFEGGLEFGYRPYRGTTDILGSGMGYSIPFEKFVGSVESNEHLAGATFTISEISPEQKNAGSFTSEDGLTFANFESKIKFDGSVAYNDSNNTVSATYEVRETDAPEGFIMDESTVYTIQIDEAVCLGCENCDGLISVNDNTIPTHVNSVITIKNGDSVLDTLNIDLQDIYSFNAESGTYEQVRRKLTDRNNGQEIWLRIENGAVVGIENGSGEVVSENAIIVKKNTGEVQDITYVESEVSYRDVANAEETADSVKESILAEDATKKITEVKKIEKNILENEKKYSIDKIAWSTVNNSNNASIDKIDFYHSDGTITTLESPTFNDGNYWCPCSNFNTENDVVGVKIVVSDAQNKNMNSLVFQDSNGNCFTNNDNNSTNLIVGETKIGYVPEVINEDETFQATKEMWEITEEIEKTRQEPIIEEVSYNQYEELTPDELQQIAIGDSTYYYNPDGLMVMPIPGSVPSFVNERGLVFIKVDKNTGERLPGAKISCYPCGSDGKVPGGTTGFVVLDKTTGAVKTINLSDLSSSDYWCFMEEEAPKGYETTTPIYLHKNGDTLECSTGLTNWTTIDIKNGQGIQMADIKISGAIIQLQKWNQDFTTQLSGAQFELYREDGDVDPKIYDGIIEIKNENETLDLYELFKTNSTLCDSTYIQNGYLTPGVYYFKEKQAATGYDQYEGNFTFKVNNNYSVEIVPSGTSSKGDPGDMYLQPDGNALLIITGKLLELAKANPDEVFVENLGVVDQIHTSSDGSDWGGNFMISDLNNCTFNEILKKSGKTADQIKFIRFMRWSDNKRPFSDATSQYYDGNPAGGSSGSSQTSVKLPIIVRVSNGEVAFGNWWDTTIDSTTYEQWGNTRFSLDGLSQDNVTGVKIEYVKEETSDNNDSGDSGNSGEENTGDVLNARLDPDDKDDKDNNSTIQIPNKQAGDTINIGVAKIWDKDTKFAEDIPDSVTVKLCRKKSDGTKDESFTVEPPTITLDKDHGWESDGWTKLEKLDGSGNNWIYYVEELAPNAHYTVKYSPESVQGGSNTIEVINTLKTIEIGVEKHWVTANGATDTDVPDSLKVNLWYSKNGTDWNILEELTLTKENDWKGTFKDLYEGYKYKVDEVEINGWTASYDKDHIITGKSETVQITNTRETGNLDVEKAWDDNNAENKRPDNITIDIYRSTIAPMDSVTGRLRSAAVNGINARSADTTDPLQYEDYARLLQYSLYFYDANMCGDKVGEQSAVNWRDNCHTYNSVNGGFHDAGDHVMFGQAQGYTASTLGWSYYEFKDAYDSLGQTKHYRVIMDEFCRFIKASTTLDGSGKVEKLLWQKGDNGTDHAYWGSPEQQGSYGSELWATEGVSDIAAEYAATLALNYLNFGDEEDLKYAKALYQFSVEKPGKSGNNYANASYKDDQAWAEAWLYLATNDDKYKESFESKNLSITSPDNDQNAIQVHNWYNVTLGAKIAYAHISGDWTEVTNWLDAQVISNDYKVYNAWGSARHNATAQLCALAAAKNITDTTKVNNYKSWAKGQMNYLLGDNDGNVCLVTGFADNSIQHPHHRAASVQQDDSQYAHTLVGALAGGPSGTSFANYPDTVKNYQENEVAIDYNAGLVGAAAGLYHFYESGNVTDGSELGQYEITPYDSTPVVKEKTPQYSKVFDVTEYLNSDTTPIFEMNIKDKATLVVKDANGKYYENATWSLDSAEGTKSDGTAKTVADIVTLADGSTVYLNGNIIAESDGIVKGKAIIPSASGEAATFSAGDTEIDFTIKVNLSAANPEIPGVDPSIAGTSEKIETLTLKADSWRASLSDLPLCDANGNKYYYYAVEQMTSGEKDSVTGKDGAVYYPISYNGNGANPGGTITVTNKTDTTNEGITMPSAGGTGTGGYKTTGLILIGVAVMGYATVYKKKKRIA